MKFANGEQKQGDDGKYIEKASSGSLITRRSNEMTCKFLSLVRQNLYWYMVRE